MGEVKTITDRGEAINALAQKAKGVRIAMLTTIGADGTPRCRPMGTREVGPEGELWFFTYEDSRKVRDVRDNPRVSLGYADHEDGLWVSVAGTAELVSDRAKAKELWSPFLRAFFPDGPDDPRIVLLRVTPEEGEIWDGPSSAVGLAVAFAKAYASGAKEPPGDDVKLDLGGR